MAVGAQLHYMAWFMFKENPSVQLRGKKVEGFLNMHRPKLDLAWGGSSLSPHLQRPKESTLAIPVIEKKLQPTNSPAHHMRVLTDSSEDQEELVRMMRKYESKRDSGKEASELQKRIRRLEEGLLPAQKDSMGDILSFKPDGMEASRLSVKSQNKRNESTVKLGDEFNPFRPVKPLEKDFGQKIREMYRYEQECLARTKGQQIKIG